MTPEQIIGIAVTIGLAIAGFLINANRAKAVALEAALEKVEEELKAVREKYVRRDDLNGHLITIDKSMTEVKDGMKDLTKLVLAALAATDKR